MDDPSTSRLRLLLVDDHAVMRAGLSNMLSARGEFDVVAEASDGETALELYRKHLPDVTLLDVMMPGMGGLECLSRLKQETPTPKVLMLSSSGLEQDMQKAIELDADGYMTKNAQPSELVAAITEIANGTKAFCSEAKHLQQSASVTDLTPRELEVLQLLRNGMSNRDVGESLGITPRTAKAHVAALMDKLDARDRAEAVARGFELGFLRP